LAAPRDRAAMERLLYTEMIRHDGLAELAFTWAPEVLRGQVALWRGATPNAPLELRRVTLQHALWRGETGRVALGEIRWMPEAATPQMDPTEDFTYSTPARQRNW